jgi:ectoine hydroxylase-related dioxygenase (phytanoyl-CoA dioxygenase family)
MEPRQPTPLDDFLFDLRGYLVLKQVVEPDLLDDLNRAIDELPPLEYGQWHGNAQRRDYTGETGFELHNCVEAGEPFERLIDLPGWISYMRHYCGEEESYTAGLFIDECILSVRRSGGHHPVHSGGYRGALRGAYQYKNGDFRCGQCNIILALTDVGPGDGPTMVIPGTHKSNFPHPLAGDYARGDRMDTLEGAIEAQLRKGDAQLFVDG